MRYGGNGTTQVVAVAYCSKADCRCHTQLCSTPPPQTEGWEENWKLLVSEFERIDEVCYENQPNCSCTLVEFLGAEIHPFISQVAREERAKGRAEMRRTLHDFFEKKFGEAGVWREFSQREIWDAVEEAALQTPSNEAGV